MRASRLSPVVLGSFLFAFLPTMPRPAAPGEAPAAEVEERPVAAIDKSRVPLMRSPDGTRIGWFEKGADGLFRFSLDGVALGPPTEEPHWVAYSPDSLHVAWSVLWGDSRKLVVDGEERGPIDGLSISSGSPFGRLSQMVLADDGRTVAWVARVQATGRYSAQLHGREPGPAFDQIRKLWLSPGAVPRLAYLGRRGDDWTLVVDGRENALPLKKKLSDARTLRPPIEGFRFSPDGKHDAFVGRTDFVTPDKAIVDGKPSPLVFKDWPAVFLDGNPQGPFAVAGVGLPVFSPDGGRLAYAIMDSSTKEGFLSGKTVTYKGSIVIDGKASRPWEATSSCDYERPRELSETVVPAVLDGIDACWAGVSSPVFSPDGKNVVWIARTGPKSYAVVRDGEVLPGPELSKMFGTPVFSRGGKLAWAGRVGGELVVFVDGAAFYKEPDRPESFVHLLTFSPDGEHLVFFTGTGNPLADTPRRLVRDGIAGPVEKLPPPVVPTRQPMAKIVGLEEPAPRPTLRFSSDGVHVAWIRDFGPWKAGQAVVLDGREGPRYGSIDSASIRFGKDGRVSYRATREKQTFEVTQPKTANFTPAAVR